MTIEPIRAGDLPQLVSLLQAEDLHEDLGMHPDTATFVARDHGAVAGGVALEIYGSSGLLRSLVVGPHWRGRSLGRGLVDRVIAEATAQDLADLTLLTLTVPEFFEKLGFRRIERRAAPEAVRQSYEFTEFCPDSAVVMTRPL